MRTLARARGFSAVIVLTLAIGMGAAVGVFAVINATLINELPYPEADRLVVLSTDTSPYFSRPGFRRLKNTPFGLDLPAAVEARQFVLTSSAMPERVWGRRISPDMTRLLGLTSTNRPTIGRLFDVRAALGATRGQIIWLQLRDSLVVLSIGLPIGLLLSIAAAAVLQRVLSDVQPYDWTVLFMATSVLAACVVIAAYAAARPWRRCRSRGAHAFGLMRLPEEALTSSAISSVIETEKSANAGKRPRMAANAKSLRLREMIAKPLQTLGFAKSRSGTPTLSGFSWGSRPRAFDFLAFFVVASVQWQR